MCKKRTENFWLEITPCTWKCKWKPEKCPESDLWEKNMLNKTFENISNSLDELSKPIKINVQESIYWLLG